MKPVIKKIFFIVMIPSAIVFVLLVTVVIKDVWSGYKWQRQVDNWLDARRKPYIEDTYGGKTPEETWGLFLDALKKGDVELASKYFVVEKQKEVLGDLRESIKLNRLQHSIELFSHQLVKEEADPPSSIKAYYHLPLENISGEREAYPIVFILNNYTEAWKIFSI